MKVEEVIGKLLLRTNCVIVPNFGGFISNTKSATIDYEKGVVYPPTKSITFNRSLSKNDGLLVTEYGKLNSLDYSASHDEINRFVREAKALLKRGERISFENVGFLYTDAHGNLLFEQDRFFNLLMEAYGMGSVQFVFEPTEHIQKQEKTAQQKEHREAPIVPLNVAKKSSTLNRIAKYAAAAALIPVLFYSFWIPTHTDVLRSGVIFKDDFNPLKKSVASIYLKKETSNIDVDYLDSTEPTFSEIIEQLPSSVAVYSFELTEDTYIPVKLEKTLSESITTSEVKTKEGYHLIAGCFGNKSNAESLIEQLTEKGLRAYIVDVHNGLHRVSADQSNNKRNLSESRAKLSANGFSSWILKK